MSNWFKIEYLFSNYLNPITTSVFRLSVVVYLLIFIGAIAFTYLRKNKKVGVLYRRLFARLSNWSFTFSLVGLLLLFFRQQQVPYLGLRAWTALWWVGTAVWMIYILKYLFKEIPKIKADIEIKKNFEKYLP